MHLSVIEGLCEITNTVLDRTIQNDREYWTKIGPEFRTEMLKSYKSSTQTRLGFMNTRLKEALTQPTPSWETINKAAKDAKKQIEAQGHIVSKDYPLLDGLRKLSPKEKAERAALQSEYTDKIIATASQHAITSHLATMISCSKRPINRSTNAFLTETGDEGYEKSAKNAELLIDGTDEEKVAFLESKLKKALEVYDLFTDKIYTDKEACKLALENYDALTYMAELEKLKDLEDDFGVTVNPELRAEIKAKTPAMVGIALYRNLLSEVMSPAYLEFDQKELYDLSKAVDMCLPANDLVKNDLLNIKQALDSAISPYEKLRSGILKEAVSDTQNPFPYKLNELRPFKDANDPLSLARGDMVKINFEKQKFPEGAKFIGLDNVEMDKETAIQAIVDGKIVNVFDKNDRLIKNYSEYSKFTLAVASKEEYDLRIDEMSPKQIREAFKAIQKEVNGTTRVFMRSSQEYRDFRSAIDTIVNMDLEDLSGGLLLTEMKNVAETAEKYLNLKQQQGVNITANTEARINAAFKVANMMRVSLTMQERRKDLDMVKVGTYEDFQKGLEEDLRDEFEDQTEKYTKSGKKIYKISEVDKAVYKAEQGKLNVEFESVYVGQEEAAEFMDGDVAEMVESDFYKGLESDSDSVLPASESKAEDVELGDKAVKDEKDPPAV